MLPQNLGTETNIKLPFSFIIYSLLALIAAQVLLILNGQLMTSGVFRIPAIWSAAHLLILGWALMAAMGSMYQLVPVAFLTKVWNETFGFIQFFLTAIGITVFAAMLYWSPQNAVFPGVLALLGILMFLFQMFMTLKSQAKPSILTLFVGTALFCLLATIILGITLTICLKTGSLSDKYPSFFQSHLLLGLTGWFTLLIFGFSYKMVPMFSLSHGFPMVQAGYVYGVYVSGLILTFISFFSEQTILLKIGFFLLLAGYSVFSWHISLILKKRLKKRLDKPFSFSIAAIGFGNLIHLAAFLSLWTKEFTSLAGPLIYAYIFLWIVLSISGYLFKIVPFLWWTHKYSKEIGKSKVPLLKDMMNEKVVIPTFSGFIAGVIIIILSMLIKSTILFNVGQWILSFSLIVIAITIFSVLKK